jgi:uncharacterized membrane protein
MKSMICLVLTLQPATIISAQFAVFVCKNISNVMCLSLQGKPVLLIPWMSYYIIFSIPETLLKIPYTDQDIGMGQKGSTAKINGVNIILLRE